MSNVSSSNSQGVHVPKLRFPGFEGEWQTRTISDFATCYAGATPSTKNRSFWDDGDIPWLSSGEVNKKHIFYTDNFITRLGFESSSTKMVPADTVVMALAGQGKTRGTVAITKIDLCTNQSLAAIVTDSTVNDNYLLYYLETQYNNLRAISSGDGTRGGLNLQIINSFKISMPDLSEQIQISQFLSVLDFRIEKQRRLVELLKSYKRGLLTHLFNRIHRFVGVYADWRKVTLGEVCEVIMGQSPDSSSYNSERKGVPLVQGNADITDGITSPLRYTVQPTKICDEKSVLISVRAPVGTVARVNRTICIGRGMCAISASNLDYIYQYLLFIQNSWKAIEQGGTFTAISGDDIRSYPMEIPTDEEQMKIARFLTQFDVQIALANKELKHLCNLKLSFMQRLFI